MVRRPLLGLLLFHLLIGCGPQATPTYFVPPTMAFGVPVAPVATIPIVSPPTAGPPAIPTVVLPSATPPCVDDLTYTQDLTIPDGSVMAPGQQIDKRWQVTNAGTCNWDERYQLKLIGGDSMGAPPSIPLYPARAGTQAILRILFTAPEAAGTYMCQWQAVGPDGMPFGDAFYMEIVVLPQG